MLVLRAATAATAAGAQADESAEHERPAVTFSDQTSVAWVLVPVSVRDARQRFVRDLRARSFRLVIDGRYQAFDSFDADAAAPLSLIQLQDLSGSMDLGGKLDAARAALACFAQGLRPGDEIALASFGAGRLSVDVPFTDLAAPVREAARAWHGYGSTALHDAVAWLPEISLEGRHPRRAAVLVTDGADNASTLAPEVARDLVRRAQLPVYVLALGNRDRSRQVASEEARSNRALLASLATVTGGAFFALDTTAQAATAACHKIAAELRHQYVLGFRITTEGTVADHRLRVEVTDPRMPFIITHRAAYRGGASITH